LAFSLCVWIAISGWIWLGGRVAVAYLPEPSRTFGTVGDAFSKLPMGLGEQIINPFWPHLPVQPGETEEHLQLRSWHNVNLFHYTGCAVATVLVALELWPLWLLAFRPWRLLSRASRFIVASYSVLYAVITAATFIFLERHQP
jgi:hypothetical protein